MHLPYHHGNRFLGKHCIFRKNCNIKKYWKSRNPQKKLYLFPSPGAPFPSKGTRLPRKWFFFLFLENTFFFFFFWKNGLIVKQLFHGDKKGYLAFPQILKLHEVKHLEAKVKISTPLTSLEYRLSLQKKFSKIIKLNRLLSIKRCSQSIIIDKKNYRFFSSLK